MTRTVNLPSLATTLRLASRAWRDRLWRHWPGHCLACSEPCHGLPDPQPGDLCADCHRQLPWLRFSCRRCALPLPAPEAGPDRKPEPAPICGQCLRHPPPLSACHAVFRYAAPLDRLLPRLKFHADLAAGRCLSTLMIDRLAAADRPDAVVALPLHHDRLRRRGYDQSLELAKPIARALQLPLRTDLLQRKRATSPQSRLDAPARHRNLRNAFVVNLNALTRTQQSAAPLTHIALIDDVMTTGATLHAAAKALQRAGVARVDAWVCARVE